MKKFRVEFTRTKRAGGQDWKMPYVAQEISASDINEAVEYARLYMLDKFAVPSHELTTRKVIQIG